MTTTQAPGGGVADHASTLTQGEVGEELHPRPAPLNLGEFWTIQLYQDHRRRRQPPPTLDEIAAAIGAPSRFYAACLVHKLRAKGYLTNPSTTPNGARHV